MYQVIFEFEGDDEAPEENRKDCTTAFEAFRFIAAHNALQFEDDLEVIQIAARVLNTGMQTLYDEAPYNDKLVIRFIQKA